jgi:hypothetical protein
VLNVIRFGRVSSVPRFARDGYSLVRYLLDGTLRAEGQGKGSGSSADGCEWSK